MGKRILMIIAIILLAGSILFNFKKWVYDYQIFGYKIYSEEINIKPSLISTMLALFLFGGFVLRNLNNIMNDYIKIIFYILDLIFFSGFIAMFSNGTTNILGFSSQSILFFAVVLMYVGIRSLLRYVLLIFIACSFLFISKVNEAMGAFGAIYILCAFISFLIQIYINILPEVNFNDKEYFGVGENKEDIENDDKKYHPLL